MALTRQQRMKIRKALAEAGQTPLEWEKERIGDELMDEKSGDLRELLFEAYVDGCKPLREKDAWTEIEEALNDAKDEYPDEDDAILAVFGGDPRPNM